MVSEIPMLKVEFELPWRLFIWCLWLLSIFFHYYFLLIFYLFTKLNWRLSEIYFYFELLLYCFYVYYIVAVGLESLMRESLHYGAFRQRCNISWQSSSATRENRLRRCSGASSIDKHSLFFRLLNYTKVPVLNNRRHFNEFSTQL